MKFLNRKGRLVLFLTVCTIFMIAVYIITIFMMPVELTLLEGEEYACSFKSPLLIKIMSEEDDIIQVSTNSANNSSGFIKIANPVSLKTKKRGTVNISMKLLGLIPLKTMKVDIVSNRKIAACGNTVGVKLKVDGILVIGISDVESTDGNRVFPIRDSGIIPGDLIIKVNENSVDYIEDLVREIDQSKGKAICITYKRGKIINSTKVTPVRSIEDKKYHIGLWVRDSTAGIGTLTFFDPETKGFGALGHGIADVDTGELMPVKSGEILESNILGIRKGERGNPGELKGVFMEDRSILGEININSEFGIYGTLNGNAQRDIQSRLYVIGLRNQIKEGPAKILSNIEGKEVVEYDIIVERVSRQNINGSKGMILRITDSRLLDITGGIVQGMSGSPIIQDGRIIGAVTHVLVNDPSKGYGIFIEAMIKNIAGNNMINLEKAG